MKRPETKEVIAVAVAALIVIPLTAICTIPWILHKKKRGKPNTVECSKCNTVTPMDSRGFCSVCQSDPHVV